MGCVYGKVDVQSETLTDDSDHVYEDKGNWFSHEWCWHNNRGWTLSPLVVMVMVGWLWGGLSEHHSKVTW